MTKGLPDLPLELIIAVLERLDFRSLCICRALCRFIHSIIDDTASLVYKLELVINGRDDNVNSNMPTAQKLEVLKRYQAAWDTLDWTQDVRYQMSDGNLWELFGNVLAQVSSRREFIFRQLPSTFRSIPEKEWTVMPDEPYNIRDFGMDPSQDLLILLEAPHRENPNHQIYCKTMSNGTKHPQVSHSGVIVHPQEDGAFELSYAIQICGDFLGLLEHSSNFNEFFVWNWKTGHLALDITGFEMKSFCFMSEHHVVLSILEIEAEINLSLLVVDFIQEPSNRKSYSEVQHFYTLCYPKLNSFARPIHFAIRSDPSPGWVPHQDTGAPFYTSPGNRLFVVLLWAIGNVGRHFLFLAVPQKTLLAHQAAMNSESKRVEWHHWGTDTRFLDLYPINTSFVIWSCYVYGSKFIFTEANFDDELEDEEIRSTLLIFDFNQYALKRAVSQGTSCLSGSDDTPTASRTDTTLCISPTKLPAEVFDDEVTTTLSYRLSALPFERSEQAPFAVMCSEDSIIAVDVRNRLNRTFRVSSF